MLGQIKNKSVKAIQKHTPLTNHAPETNEISITDPNIVQFHVYKDCHGISNPLNLFKFV